MSKNSGLQAGRGIEVGEIMSNLNTPRWEKHAPSVLFGGHFKFDIIYNIRAKNVNTP